MGRDSPKIRKPLLEIAKVTFAEELYLVPGVRTAQDRNRSDENQFRSRIDLVLVISTVGNNLAKAHNIHIY